MNVDQWIKHTVHGIGEKWISCLHQHIPLICSEIHILYICVCACVYITFTQWVEINNQICTSLLIKSTSFLSPQLLARCLCGIHLAALSILHSHPSFQSPDTPAFCSWSPQQVQRKAWSMGIINTPAAEHLGGNKGPNSNFNVPSSSRSENTLCDHNMLESPSVTFPLQEEMLQVNRALTAVPPSGLLMEVPTGSWALVILVCLSFWARSQQPGCSKAQISSWSSSL